MELKIKGRPAGLAVWGWGVQPKSTPRHLFPNANLTPNDYLELCRFFVYDWCPPNTASKFLACTHRLIKKYTDVKFLYTYAAGFQGLVGYIYKAAGYDYLGKQECTACIYIPGVGLIHWVSIWHRYHLPIGSGRLSAKCADDLRKIFPGAMRWGGHNFRYLYWLCTPKEREQLMKQASFRVQQYPTADDLEIWTEDEFGKKTMIEPDFAKTVPIVKLKTKRVRGVGGDTSANHAEEGGSIPTRTLS